MEVQTTPKAVELEAAVIGAMLIDKKGADDVMSVIKTPHAFYDARNAEIFLAAQEMYFAGDPIDLLSVGQKLRQRGALANAGGDVYLITLTQSISSSAHTEHHCRILLQQMVRRMIIAFNANVTAMAYDETVDVFDLMQRWTKEFDKINDLIKTGKKAETVASALEILQQRIEMLSAGNGDTVMTGLSTGFRRINRQTGGYHPGNLIIIAARPAMGKTAEAIKIAIENARSGVPVGFISGEMAILELVGRIVAVDTNFHLGQLLKTGFEKPQYFTTFAEHKHRIAQYPIYIDDSGALDITDVVVECRRMVRMYGVKMIVIDYIQLMSDRSKGNNREQEISAISRRLKKLAKELGVVIIALSQLSRRVEDRRPPRPILADLRESGAIEQDADIVQFIYRPEYYGLEMEDERLVNIGANAEVIYAKYRGGSVFTTGLKWIGDKTKFVDPEDENEAENNVQVEGSYEAKPLPTPTAAQAFDAPMPGNNDDDMPF